MKILITENQLKSVVIPYFNGNKDIINDELITLKENWSKLKKEEKILVLELYRVIYPEKYKQINEGAMDWIQGGLDVVGIFDPTGITDLTNAVLYFGRGEVLFGMLSLISIIPVAGDAIAKPIILGGKALGLPFKTFKAAVASGDAVKIANSAKSMEKLGPVGKKIVEFIESFNKGMGEKITNLLNRGKKIPLVGKFFKTIEDWIGVFKKAAKEIKVPTKSTKFQMPGGATYGWKGTLKGSEKIDFIEFLKQMKPSGKGTTAFRDMAKKGKFKILGKEFTKVWQSPPHRKMLGRTKIYLRYLDALGFANFIGPDELIQQMPDVEKSFEEFVDTPQGQAAFNEEFGSNIYDQEYDEISYDQNTSSSKSIDSLAKKLGITELTPDTITILSQILKTA
jgi:hypothetical protein